MANDKLKGKQLKKVPPGRVQVYEKPARPSETRRRKLFHKGKKFSFKRIGKKTGGYTVTNRYSDIMLPEKKRTTRIT